MDPISIGALVIAIITGITTLVSQLHIRKCNSPCMDSECMEKSDSKNSSRNNSINLKQS